MKPSRSASHYYYYHHCLGTGDTRHQNPRGIDQQIISAEVCSAPPGKAISPVILRRQVWCCLILPVQLGGPPGPRMSQGAAEAMCGVGMAWAQIWPTW